MKTFGYDAVKLSEAYGLDELNQLREAVVNDPASLNPVKSIFIYSKAAQRKLDALSWAVVYVLADKRKAAVAS